MELRDKPRNAYELMEKAIENMKARPETYLQERFVIRGAAVCAQWGRERCETAYCRAGHIVMAYDGSLPEDSGYYIQDRAVSLLGLGEGVSTASLFNGAALFHKDGLRESSTDDRHAVSYTTNPKEYLRRGIRGMRAFMRMHRVALKARVLGPQEKR